MAESVKHPTSAQVMISQFTSSSPALASVLTAQSLEPASDSVSPNLSLSLSLSLPHSGSYSLSLSKINIKKVFLKEQRTYPSGAIQMDQIEPAGNMHASYACEIAQS